MPKTQHVYALFDTSEAATAAYASVRARGCSDTHCSAILHSQHVDEESLPAGERASREGARKGALVGTTTGAIIGGLAAVGGGLLGVGPLAAVICGAGALAGYGTLLGGISASDDPESHLKMLEREVEAGKILIAVETDDRELKKMCKEVFEEHGGRTITC